MENTIEFYYRFYDLVYNPCWGIKYAEILDLPAIMNNFLNHDFAAFSLTLNNFYDFPYTAYSIKRLE